jgi:diketogulonate reductase-like aldo/keto reductase
MRLVLFVSALGAACSSATPGAAVAAAIPNVMLGNDRGTAQPGLLMPAIGLGTGAYSDAKVSYGAYPECWSSTAGCGAWAQQAVKTWLAAGGRRIDAANSYQDDADVGAAMGASGVPRQDIFLLSKVGPSQPLGYADTLAQFGSILTRMNVSYVDTLLIHWPWPSASKGNVTNNATQSTDPFCNTTALAYDEVQCRLSTWRAMLQIYATGGARAIGVCVPGRLHPLGLCPRAALFSHTHLHQLHPPPPLPWRGQLQLQRFPL